MGGTQPVGVGETTGPTFGGYRLAHVLATGGMATVYLGRKDGPGGFAQHAAIKVIHPNLVSEPEFVELFLDEASIASCINHPNVCRVLSFGEAEFTYYLALEYVRGETWAHTLASFEEDHLPVPERAPFAVHVVAQACEGLHAAHEALSPSGERMDIVHRDVSPENLLIAYDGNVRVVDFGVATARKRRHHTATGTVRGRYAYMAPEQMAGHPVDRRADVWSLGVVLRESLEGRHPFRRATDPETIHAVTHGTLPPWEEHVSPRLREIVDRCMQHDRTQRYASARELGHALAAWLLDSSHATVGHALGEHMHRLFRPHIEAKQALVRDSSRVHERATRPSLSARLRRSWAPREAAASTPPARRPRGKWVLSLVGLVGLLLAAWKLLPSHLGRPTVSLASPAAAASEGEAAPSSQNAPPLEAAVSERPKLLAESAGPPPRPRATARARAVRRSRAAAARRRREAVDRRPEPQDAEWKPRAAASQPDGEPGVLVVGARSGWAQVNVDGKQVGNTPIRLEVRGGRHVVTTVPFGEGTPTRHDVRVVSGESTKLVVEL